MKKSLVIHPILIALFPIFSVFSSNAVVLPLSIMFLPIGLMLISTLLFFAVFYFISREIKKAGLMTSTLVFFSFFYPAFRIWMRRFTIGGIVLGRHRFLIPVFGTAFILILWKILRTRKDLSKATNFLNVFAIILLMTSILNVTYYRMEDFFTSQEAVKPKLSQVNQDEKNRVGKIRDIYYIVLDNYVSSHTLKKEYSYDNTEFTDFLIKKGFYVAFDSHSNYLATQNSLASSLNMRYITDELNNTDRSYNKQYAVVKNLLKDNIVKDFLKKFGYKFIYFGTGRESTMYNEHADLNYQGALLNEFSYIYLCKTPFAILAPILQAYDIRRTVLRTFSNLGKVPDIEGPKFIFAHIYSPHEPYVFQADGKPPLSFRSLLKKEDRNPQRKDLFLGQLRFVNSRVKILVKEILSKSKIQPIIIIQGDHGERARINNQYAEGEYFKQAAGILNAYYLPDGGGETIYSSITPVNTFRTVFNHYFDADYKMLNDRLYHHVNTKKEGLEFIDFTNYLKE